ncbi:hypothetical protein DQ237_10395 [Blastococcus sp. TF02-8]|uniref:glycosyltransferase family 4 protein n=1 Tax=Blastococcus sp. TF02-8 TaxID=2250574 RepID=UPI000DE8C271|nr:glycosyltransferase family 4 protein [Blastococcus sp. TF02-8]RBY96261.1 hypothetical protein DQ237_10395 [Blastococcus sp. TF02-8]
MSETRPLKIAMISYYLPSGSKIGVGHQVHALANGLVERGHDVTVFSGCGPSDGARYTTVQIPLAGALRTFRFATALRRVDLSGFDVLHAHGDDYWLWRRRVPAHVRTMHGSCFEEARRIKGAKEKLRMVALGLGEELATIVADRTVVVSPDTRRWMPWVKTVIPNGVDGRRFSPGAGPLAERPTILFVGTYLQRKRGRLLMEAFSDVVRPAIPDAELWMVSTDAPPASGVVQWGRVDDETLVDLYRKAWVFCLPSLYEGFGIPYAEALAAGTPVVATPNPGSRYVLQDGTCGVLAEDSQLGSALLGLLNDPGERERLSHQGVERSRQFELQSVLDSYERLYRTTAARRRPAG